MDLLKVGIIAGKFKPPHRGHYDVISKIAKENDFTNVFVSPVEMDGITGKAAVKVLRTYVKGLREVDINLAEGSPVKAAFEFVSTLGKKEFADTVQLNIYALAEDMNRFKNIEKFAGNIAKINRVVTARSKGISGTNMRDFVRKGDKENFVKGVPKNVDGDVVWQTVREEGYAVPADSFTNQTRYADPNVQPTPISTNLGAIPNQWTNSAPYSRWDLNPSNNITQFRRNPDGSGANHRVKTFSEYVSETAE